MINRFTHAMHLAMLKAFPVCFFYMCSCVAGGSDTVVPEILSFYSHATTSFTQGLLVEDGVLYESTGQYGGSSLRRLNLATGNVEAIVPVAGEYFAEGIAVHQETIVQLTWRSQKAFVYSVETLKTIDTLEYKGQGWGLTIMGDLYVMANGSDSLYFRDAQFKVVKTIPVQYRGVPKDKLNELEFARGKIYANVWYSTDILEIDPTGGRVTRVIDCSELLLRVGAVGKHDVLNGIAYKPSTDTFLLTGKNWPSIFEVRIP